jgi:GSCFA family
MKTFSARQSIKNFQSSGDFAKWAVANADTAALGYEYVTGDMAGNRVFNGLLDIKVNPKFKLGVKPKIFTTGSCFAREIEFAFHHAGIPVLSWNPESGMRNELFHRYNTFAMLNDFRYALEGGYDEQLAMETPIGWIDYSSNGVCASREELLMERHRVIDTHKNILQSDVLVVTLGLVEAWYDKKTETYLNFTPSEILATNLSRFECRVTDYSENLLTVKNLVKYLRDRVNPSLKIIITVSPVPLNVSFSDKDIVQSNTLSKATLRAVAQTVADEDEYVDYFPSYEIVTLSNPNDAWLPDRRHVKREAVEHIVKIFKDAYLE